jgi:hypothetical protein
MQRNAASNRALGATLVGVLAVLAFVADGCGGTKKSDTGSAAEEGSQACISVRDVGKLCGDAAKEWCKGHPDKSDVITGDCASVEGKEAVSAKTDCADDEIAIYTSSGKTLLDCAKKSEAATACPEGKDLVGITTPDGKKGFYCKERAPEDQYKGPTSTQSSSGGGNGSGDQYCYEANAPNRYEPGCQGTLGPPPSGSGGSGSDGSGSSGSQQTPSTGGGTEHNYSPDQCVAGEVYDSQQQTCVPG